MNSTSYTRLAILAELNRQPTHGYDLLSKLPAYGIDIPNTGGLYRTLRGMVEEGLVEAEWDTPQAGPARRVHRLTTFGAEEMVAQRKVLHGDLAAARRLLETIPRGGVVTETTTLRSWTLTIPSRPLPANQHRKLHWAERNRYNKIWRECAFYEALNHKVPKLDAIGITVQQVCAKGQVPDPDGLSATQKACLDGLRDAKVIPDDTGVHVKWVRFLPPVKGPADALVLTIQEETP